MLSTRARVIALTPGLACSARSTVPVEMPSARAMSLMPTGGAGAVGFRASEDMRKPYYLTSDHVACVRRGPRRHSVRLAAAGRTGRPRDDSRRRLRPGGADEA